MGWWLLAAETLQTHQGALVILIRTIIGIVVLQGGGCEVLESISGGWV